MDGNRIAIRRNYKILLTGYCLLMIYAFFSLHNSEVTGYEISIYYGTPLIFWIFIIISLIAGLLLVAKRALIPENSRLWILGFILLLMTNFIMCSLYALRGYFLYNPIDPTAHIGMINDIINSGSAGVSNIYPAIHLLLAQVSMLCNVPVLDLARLIPAFLSVIYMLSIYLLATVFIDDRRYRYFAILCSVPLLFSFFHTGLYPQGFAFFMVPLTIYFYIKSCGDNSLFYRILLVILLMVMAISHPHTEIVVIIFLFVAEGLRILKIRSEGHSLSESLKMGDLLFIPVALSVSVFIFWISRFSDFGGKISHISNVVLKGQIVPGQLTKAQNSLGTLDFTSFIELFIKLYGHIAIYGLLTLISFVLILMLYRNHRLEGNYVPLLLIVWIVMSELFNLVFFILVQSQVPTRVIASDNLLLLSPLFVAFLFYYIFSLKISVPSIYKVAAVVFIIAIISSIGMMSLYRSPWTFQPNWQSTKMDYYGTDWIYENRDPLFIWNGLSALHSDFELMMGHEKFLSVPDVVEIQARLGYYEPDDVPPHFNFTYSVPEYVREGRIINLGDLNIGEALYWMKDFNLYQNAIYRDFYYLRYWIITERGKTITLDESLKERHVSSHSEMARWDFDDVDFLRLENDPTIQKIYTNGENDIVFIELWAIEESL